VEYVLERDELRAMPEQLPRQSLMQRAEALLDRIGCADLQHTVRQVTDSRPSRVLDDAEPAAPRARIDPQDLH
jgi:hypothetical protein